MDFKPILLTAALGCLPLSASAAGVAAPGAATIGGGVPSGTSSQSVNGGGTTTGTPSNINVSPGQEQSPGSSMMPGMSGQGVLI